MVKICKSGNMENIISNAVLKLSYAENVKNKLFVEKSANLSDVVTIHRVPR